MAITNHERVGKALELLKAGLGPFVDREIRAAIASNSLSMQKVRGFVDGPILANKSIGEWDSAGLLKLMWETRDEVFPKRLGFAGRTLLSERPCPCPNMRAYVALVARALPRRARARARARARGETGHAIAPK